jgi:hypothetical protein
MPYVQPVQRDHNRIYFDIVFSWMFRSSNKDLVLSEYLVVNAPAVHL